MDAAELEERYARVKASLPAGVTLVAVSKKRTVQEIAALYALGQRDFGENYAQELRAKQPALPADIRWHFIGHLQSNKAKAVDRVCELVHAVDTDSTARRLTVPWLLEVNLSGEATKAGVAPEAVGDWVVRDPGLRGLMTMPPLAADAEASRPWFRRLRELAGAHGLHDLSMGTSQDWRVAVEEGATYVRVGSALWSDAAPG